jgi:CBS domain-containing protein
LIRVNRPADLMAVKDAAEARSILAWTRRAAMKIRDIMHKGVASVAPETPLPALARKMRDMDIGALPVVEEGKVVGMVTDRDIAVRAVPEGADVAVLRAGDVMSRDVLCCREGEEAHWALAAMELRKVRRMPVLSDAGELVGMVGLGDIAAAHRPDLVAEVVKAVAVHRP